MTGRSEMLSVIFSLSLSLSSVVVVDRLLLLALEQVREMILLMQLWTIIKPSQSDERTLMGMTPPVRMFHHRV